MLSDVIKINIYNCKFSAFKPPNPVQALTEGKEYFEYVIDKKVESKTFEYLIASQFEPITPLCPLFELKVVYLEDGSETDYTLPDGKVPVA